MPHAAAMPAPQALLLPAAGHTCVAWWHAPAAPASPLAVVLASSWGEEDMSCYDGLRKLAVRLAESGLGTLRFEWPDTGDSSAPTGSTTIAHALAAFDVAATQALALSGCERLAFVGLRLGALLAAHAAVARQDVDALVAMMPVVSGRAFVREQRMLGAGMATPAPLFAPGAVFDAANLPVQLGGFTLSVRHLEALSVLKWPSAATTSVLEALLLWPPDSPGRAASDALARMGMRVREWAHEDLAGVLAIADQAALAPAPSAEIVRWLLERAADVSVTHGVPEIEGFGVADAGNDRAHAAVAAARLESATAAVLVLSGADAPVWMRLQSDGVAVRERIVQLDDAVDLLAPGRVAILGERDLAGDTAGRPPRRALVLLSSGRERRIGPHRLWVPWARRRAALGDVVLRLDVAGIGDSTPHSGPNVQGRPSHYDARTSADIARAVAWLRREHGVGECTVMGVCAGAFHAWRAAVEGVDIQQVVAINPRVFHWRPDMSLDPSRPASGQIAAVSNAVRLSVRNVARLLHWPLEDDLGADMVRVAARGVAMDFVFSRREPALTLMREEAGWRGARLVRGGLAKVFEVAHADPTFSEFTGRAALYARLDAILLHAPSMISPTLGASPRRTAVLHA